MDKQARKLFINLLQIYGLLLVYIVALYIGSVRAYENVLIHLTVHWAGGLEQMAQPTASVDHKTKIQSIG